MIAPKVAPPTPAESRHAYELVKERSFGLCEICGVRQATETHHRLHRSHGTLDTPENLLRVCGRGNTSGCHGDAHTASERYARGFAVRTGYDPATTAIEYRGRLCWLMPDGGIEEIRGEGYAY